DQAHQVRLLAAELGGHQIRVNGINPDGVVRGSGIFAGGWGASRAKVYGVEEEDLGEFYAQRTLLKREVLPATVASAVFALTAGDLTHPTGLHVPVDAGVAAAFLRGAATPRMEHLPPGLPKRPVSRAARSRSRRSTWAPPRAGGCSAWSVRAGSSWSRPGASTTSWLSATGTWPGTSMPSGRRSSRVWRRRMSSRSGAV